MSYYIVPKDELCHYGIKGMRWGHHKPQEENTDESSKGTKNTNKTSKGNIRKKTATVFRDKIVDMNFNRSKAHKDFAQKDYEYRKGQVASGKSEEEYRKELQSTKEGQNVLKSYDEALFKRNVEEAAKETTLANINKYIEREEKQERIKAMERDFMRKNGLTPISKLIKSVKEKVDTGKKQEEVDRAKKATNKVKSVLKTNKVSSTFKSKFGKK